MLNKMFSLWFLFHNKRKGFHFCHPRHPPVVKNYIHIPIRKPYAMRFFRSYPLRAPGIRVVKRKKNQRNGAFSDPGHGGTQR
jgi:hypothetical protein